jgi:endonuclease/exonuclease/phosphatase family metal-dependent hydrolase
MSSRREFLRSAAAVGVLGSVGVSPDARAAESPAPATLRTITYNIYEAKGWSRQKYLSKEMDKPAGPEHLLDMARRFADALRVFAPDLVTFQESPAREIIEAIAKHLEMKFAYFPSGENWPGALLTRFEIASSRNCPIAGGGERPKDLFTRHWGTAVLKTPGGELIVHSVHLHPSKSEVRALEVTEVIKAIEPVLAAKRPLILQGDFNHPPTGPEYPRWKEAGLIDIFETFGVNAPETIPADKPEGRIDFVWASRPLAKRAKGAQVLNRPPFRPEKEGDPASLSLSDHMPVLAMFAM